MAVTIPNTQRRDVAAAYYDSITCRVLLDETAGGATVDKDADEFVSDVAFDELDDASYSRKTVTLTAATADDVDDEGVVDASDVTWSSLAGGESIEQAIFYEQVGGDDLSPGDDPVICGQITTEMPITTNGSDVVFSFDAEGFVNLG